MKPYLLIFIFIIGFYQNAQAQKISLGAGLTYGTESGIDLSSPDLSEGQLGLTVRAHLELRKWGALGGFNYYFPSNDTQRIGLDIVSLDSNLSQVYADATYKLLDLKIISIYGLAGLNYSFESGEKITNSIFSTRNRDKVGFEYGVGARIIPGFFGEIKHQAIDRAEQFVFTIGYQIGLGL